MRQMRSLVINVEGEGRLSRSYPEQGRHTSSEEDSVHTNFMEINPRNAYGNEDFSATLTFRHATAAVGDAPRTGSRQHSLPVKTRAVAKNLGRSENFPFAHESWRSAHGGRYV